MKKWYHNGGWVFCLVCWIVSLMILLHWFLSLSGCDIDGKISRATNNAATRCERIIDEKIEEVKKLYSVDDCLTKEELVEILQDLGYQVEIRPANNEEKSDASISRELPYKDLP